MAKKKGSRLRGTVQALLGTPLEPALEELVLPAPGCAAIPELLTSCLLVRLAALRKLAAAEKKVARRLDTDPLERSRTGNPPGIRML